MTAPTPRPQIVALPTAHAFTVSEGPRTNPAGRRIPIALFKQASPAAALAELLRQTQPRIEGWWSPNTWEGNRRNGAKWQAAGALVVDLDYHNAGGEHAPPPPELRALLEQAAREGKLPGNVFHLTPRGARLVFVPPHPVADRAHYARALEGACVATQRALEQIGVYARQEDARGGLRDGYAVDLAATDLARILYTPRAIVGKVHREARVLVLCEEACDLEQLAALAPPPPKPRPAAVRDPRASSDLAEAARRWNADHPVDWPRSGGECPACKHRDCFGSLPTLPGRWVCFSGNHGLDSGECGHWTGKVWVGDALDLEACERKCSPADVLRTARYLVEGEPRSSSATGNGAAGAGPARGRTLETFNATDLGNAGRLAAQHAHELRYCAPWREWLTWDGRRWARDRDGAAVRRAVETVRSIYGEAEQLENEAERKARAKHARDSEAQRRIAGMMELAKSDLRVAVLPEAFDGERTRYLLNVLNGTLDLRTGELRPHSREDHITKLAPVEYVAGARSERWEGFLERVLPDPQVRAFLQRYAGSALTGDTGDQAFSLLHGTGANGKSTFLETQLALLGEYAHQAAFETFLEATGRADRRGGPRSDLVALHGVRLVAAIEAGEGRRLDPTVIKQLTGGDTITARGMYQAEETSYVPEAKLFLAANHRPEVRDEGEAMWRRVFLVPFTVRIPEAERDKTLKAWLREPRELSGILAWALAGCRDWWANATDRLRPPDAVLAATRDYRQEQDHLAAFLEDRCILEPRVWVANRELRTAYLAWCEENGDRPLSSKALAYRLRERGCEPDRSGGGKRSRGWAGIRLRDMMDATGGDG